MKHTRSINNFFNSIGRSDYNLTDLSILNQFADYLKKQEKLPKYRVALCFICVNEQYWRYIKDAIEGAKEFFLPGHEVDYFLWSDTKNAPDGVKIFDIDPAPWPMPTLMRYHVMLQQEEILKDYDYVFYCDIDMKWVGIVGDEILGGGITAAQHPMYALRKEYIYPTELNTESTAFIKKIEFYYAGGFQGGKSDKFIEAMKVMKKNIDMDFAKNYTARWNDESHWNKYLFDNPPAIILTPSYIYPDSLINEYYLKVWGCNYPPKLVTLTKPFTTSSEGGESLKKTLETL